ncbi:MAG: prepilin peptidase [Gammaproteobacteria bacterium]|nr:prepilin peptidase [Gammaproteobacteria bacterium]MYC98085.1 prepilin peptidase [Gammaproteobacteria bacterium]
MTNPVVLALAGLVGLALGSFLNVCVARWPRGGSVVRPRSACPACSAPIRWYDQIPVVSWFLLRGRCRKCGARVSLSYPLVETAGAAICVLVVLTCGVSLEAVAAAFFLLVLLGIALTDARLYLIPDQFSLGGAAAGLALSLAPGGITPGSATTGVVVGFGGMWLVATVGTWVLARARPGRLEDAGREHAQGRRRAREARGVRVLARPRGQLAALLPALPIMVVVGWWFGPPGVSAAVAASAAGLAVLVTWVEGLGEDADATAPVSPAAALGGGDVKMMALVGAFTGPWGAVLTVFLAALAGLLAYLKLRMLLGTRHLVPLGVFLAVGAAITLWWGQALLDWYLRLSGLT